MVKNHLKRMAAPKSWPLSRKEEKFVTRPFPGKPFELAMPVNQLMKALLRKGKTTKEVRHILNSTEVLLNGTRVYDQRQPVAFMDVISFPEIDERYTLGLTQKGKLEIVSLTIEQAQKRYVKVAGKHRLQGKTQLNCWDGTNILVTKDDYKTNDTLELNGKKIVRRFPLEPEAHVILTGGKHVGKKGKVIDIKNDIITVEAGKETISTNKRYAFVTGKDSEEVKL